MRIKVHGTVTDHSRSPIRVRGILREATIKHYGYVIDIEGGGNLVLPLEGREIHLYETHGSRMIAYDGMKCIEKKL